MATRTNPYQLLTTILLVALVGLSVYIVSIQTSTNTLVEQYEEKFDALQKDYDSLTTTYQKITPRLDTLNTQIATVDGELRGVSDDINVVRNQTRQTVDEVRKYTSSDIQQFLFQRYRSKVDSVQLKAQEQLNTNLPNIYIVQPNNTLYSISKKTGVPVNKLKQYNGLTTNKIVGGQKLYLQPR